MPSSSSPLVASAQQRARVANRAALPAELIAAGFSLSSTLPLGPQELLQLHRRRLTADERVRVLRATGASHIVGDDALCPSSGRGGAGLADFWKIAPAYSWGGASLPIPLVVFPDHLVRLRERVAWELEHNAAVQHVVVLVSVPRATLDASTSWASFAHKVDPALLQGWGEHYGVDGVLGFAEPLQLLRFPSAATTVPPATWEIAPLSANFAAVALKIGRRSAGDLDEPSFR